METDIHFSPQRNGTKFLLTLQIELWGLELKNSDLMEDEGEDVSVLLKNSENLPHRCASAVPESLWAAFSFLSPWTNPQCTHGK